MAIFQHGLSITASDGCMSSASLWCLLDVRKQPGLLFKFENSLDA